MITLPLIETLTHPLWEHCGGVGAAVLHEKGICGRVTGHGLYVGVTRVPEAYISEDLKGGKVFTLGKHKWHHYFI